MISVVIPCRNAARWLSAAIASVMENQEDLADILVVDDGSVDDLPKVISKWDARLLNNVGSGACDARNTGLNACRGEFVQFLDADDYLLSGKLIRQRNLLNENRNAGAVYGRVRLEVWANGKQDRHEESAPFQTADPFGLWLGWQFPQTGGLLWRTEKLRALGGWKAAQPCAQDYELVLRALLAGFQFVEDPEEGAVYRIWSEGTLSRKSPTMVIDEQTKLIKEAREKLIAKGEWSQSRQMAAGSTCFRMARTLAKYDIERASTYFRECMDLGLIHMAPPAGPVAYRMMVRLLGFELAEKLALMRRKR